MQEASRHSKEASRHSKRREEKRREEKRRDEKRIEEKRREEKRREEKRREEKRREEKRREEKRREEKRSEEKRRRVILGGLHENSELGQNVFTQCLLVPHIASISAVVIIGDQSPPPSTPHFPPSTPTLGM
jgi:hypothetical protein